MFFRLGTGGRGSTKFSESSATSVSEFLVRLGGSGYFLCVVPEEVKKRTTQYERTAQRMQKSQKGKSVFPFATVPNSFQFPSSSNIRLGRNRRITTIPIKYKIAAKRSVLICRMRRLFFA